MNAKARANFINSVAVQVETVDNSNQSSSGITQGEISKNTDVPNDSFEEEIFAQGLPNWDLEPPQVAVRRIRKK